MLAFHPMSFNERLLNDYKYAVQELEQIASGTARTADEIRASAAAALATLIFRQAFWNRDAALAEADRPDAGDLTHRGSEVR